MHHHWDKQAERRLLGHESPDGNERVIRICKQCGVIRTTVLPPTPSRRDIWIEYQTMENGPVWFERIDCVPAKLVDNKETGA